jgi:type III restriction enzyme
MSSADALSNPILNSPYEPPSRYWELGPSGPTGEIKDGRRPSESFIPVPIQTKGKQADEQIALDFDATGERREDNPLINDIRRTVELWRARGWNGVTPYTRKLLEHWAPGPHRDDPVLFCQREAVETSIFLTEIAGRHGYPDFRDRVEPQNALHNDGLPRVGLKMATGTGKTVVMAMLVAWHTINKVMSPSDARFVKQFLVVTPGITIRDRLGVLLPSRADNYYKERDLVPNDLWEPLQQAQVRIVNYHTFLPREAKEVAGVARKTKLLLNPDPEAFKEKPDDVAARVLRQFTGGKGGILVFNDEAHHCYQDKLLEVGATDADAEDKERNRDARVWFRGILDLRRRANIKAVYDLSATPYYLKGSGYSEGFIFPWVVSDFSLMDAIESGIVKVPRVPVDDDAEGKQVVYLNLWDNIDPPLPKKKGAADSVSAENWTMPVALEGALKSLFASYSESWKRYEEQLAALGEPPPVMIVVCPNTIVSKLVFDWIAGYEFEGPDGDDLLATGKLDLFSNVEDGNWVRRQRTILVDSAQLESGEPLGADFRKVAAHEIEAFKQEWRLRNPGGDPDQVSDGDLLREVMNTIGKKDRLGEHIRCVVSVSMLTEGWDANTVTHILGVRPFRSQLLCEQVVGRGLRRRNYAVNADGMFEPEYAEVYGVPFAFIPGDKQIPKGADPRVAVEVRSELARADYRIEFPKVDGYRVEMTDEVLVPDFTKESGLHLTLQNLATWTKVGGIAGAQAEMEIPRVRNARDQQIAFELAKTLLEREDFFAGLNGDERPWLFARLVEICRDWLTSCVTAEANVPKGCLLLAEVRLKGAEKVFQSIIRNPGAQEPTVLPILRRFDPDGSTDEVRYVTRKVVKKEPPVKSHLNHVVLDGIGGNQWEEALADFSEKDSRVAAYVKNERLDFTIPYVHAGRSHSYIPDFLLRLVTPVGDEVRTLIVEVSGTRKSPGPREAKAETARNQWCAAVNNWGLMGRWGYVEIGDPRTPAAMTILEEAIENLLADRPITGLPTLLSEDH